MHRIAHPPSAGARLTRSLAVVVCLLTTVLGGPLLAQTPDPLGLVIEPLLAAKDPEVRGEAALAVATTGDERYADSIRALTEDRDATVRSKAVLALGLLGNEGADATLEAVLRRPRHADEALLATLALALLPDEPRVAALDRFFRDASSASRRRIRERLVCVLLGLRHTAHPLRAAQLRRYLDDATYRNRPELALVIDALAHDAAPETIAAIAVHLDTREPQILHAVLRALRQPKRELDETTLRKLVRIARQHKPEFRAAALDLLTFLRHPEALDVADAALTAPAPACRAAAVRTILKLGGGALRRSVEDAILATADAGHQAAMLAAKSGPHSDDFVRACLRLTRDASQAFPVRVAAAQVVSQAGWLDIRAPLIELFKRAESPADLRSLARSLNRVDVPIDEKVLPTKTVRDAARLPARLRALVGTGHQDAQRVLFGLLTKPKTPGQRLEALRAYRQARVRLLDATSERLVPRAIRATLR